MAADTLPWSETPQGRLHVLEYIIGKRVKNLEYLRRVHNGGTMWMNCVWMTAEDVERHFDPAENRVAREHLLQWFTLGLSLAPLLALPNGWQFLCAVERLVDEWEYHFASGVERMIRGLRQPGGRGGDEQRAAGAAGAAAFGSGASAASVQRKVTGLVTYDYLTTPTVPIPLSYLEVVLSLASILTFAYRKFLDHDTTDTAGGLAKVIRIDKRFKHHFFGLLSRELERLSVTLLGREQRKLADLFASFTAPDGSRGGALVSLAPSQPAAAGDESDEDFVSVQSGEQHSPGSAGWRPAPSGSGAAAAPLGTAPSPQFSAAQGAPPSPVAACGAMQEGPLMSSFAGLSRQDVTGR
eukprot:TRINITY_DN34189_c0_g1_i1.p1 TRINITY_DN34189_c0_g1~~TRINITY_DN34189_c0_g1_i1.p1  ORF type:complete len:353 (+),score=89.74 TRINITY_DN34189_c0_g1_i1:79-1137(+)